MRKIDQWLIDMKAAYQPIVIGLAEEASGSEPPKVAQLANAAHHPKAEADQRTQADNPTAITTVVSDDVQQRSAIGPTRD
jgi:hypothetical protein